MLTDSCRVVVSCLISTLLFDAVVMNLMDKMQGPQTEKTSASRNDLTTNNRFNRFSKQ